MQATHLLATSLSPVLALKLTARPHARHTWLVDSLLVLGGSLFVAAMAQVAFQLPFSPVPITGQTFAVLLVGAVLGARRGALSLALYALEGAMGLPFFAGGLGGALRLAGPTGGYIAGFILAAALVGYLAEHGWDRRWFTALPAFAAGMAVIYLCGALWLSVLLGPQQALQLGVLPFLAGDVLKALLASAALPSAWALVRAFSK